MSASDFLSRWSRRKQQARAQELALPPERPQEENRGAESVEAAPASSELPDTKLPALPNIEDLTAETDISGFLRPGVPAALRNAALRRTWSLDPTIRDFVSEAREYAYDWNTPGGVPGSGPLSAADHAFAAARVLLAGAGESLEDSDAATGASESASDAPPKRPPEPAQPASLEAPRDTAPAHDPGVPAAVAEEPSPRPRRHGTAVPL